MTMRNLKRQCTVCDEVLPLIVFEHQKQKVHRVGKAPMVLGTFDDVCLLCMHPRPLAEFVNPETITV